MSQAISQRALKVNELIKQELSQIILREIDFPKNVLVTLTRVKTSNNLIQAKVFISVIPEKFTNNALQALNQNIYNLQQKLNKRLHMRPIPRIEFKEETKTKEAGRIESTLEKIKLEKDPKKW